jgi:hypothetical protein
MDQRTGPAPAEHREVAPARRVLVPLAVGLGLLLIAVAVGIVLSGCGRTEPLADQAATPASEPAAVAAVQSGEAGGSYSLGSTSGVAEGAGAAVPDLDATVTQSVVLPGDTVEIVARATADAVSVSLWDGYGDRRPLTYGETTNLWRGEYRVPLRASWDRLGLSVTARNEANRWRRVWVFLNMKPEESVAESDSLER